jgi:hemoglobin
MKKLFTKLQNLIIKPTVDRPFYQAIGEEKGVYELVKNFYAIMENDPKATDCLHTHQLTEQNKIPDEVKKKLFMFLCGWFGGPNLFVETYGHPRMRARHLHVKINSNAKAQWLYCMHKALQKHSYQLSRTEMTKMMNSFTALASRIQNT